MKTLFQVSIKRTCREGYRHETKERDLQWVVSRSEGTKQFDTLSDALAYCNGFLRTLERTRLGE